jgi:predicted ATPase
VALWLLGYPRAALADVDQAINNAREIGHPVTSIIALIIPSFALILSGKYASANERVAEAVAMADEKGILYLKALAMTPQGWVAGLTGDASSAVQLMSSAIIAWRSTGATAGLPITLQYLARAHAQLSQFDDAWQCIDEATTAVEVTKEKWWEAEIHRTAGVVALMTPEPDAAKAQAYFERALAVAREQQARSWELRAAMSMARFWRDQGKRRQAHDLLAPVYSWFTEGFDTLDLKEAKALLEQLKP